MTLPSSLEEKMNDFNAKEGYYPHWVFVHELKTLLGQLEDTDWVTPNQVWNLTIHRANPETGEGVYIGYIDLLTNKVVIFGQESDD